MLSKIFLKIARYFALVIDKNRRGPSIFSKGTLAVPRKFKEIQQFQLYTVEKDQKCGKSEIIIKHLSASKENRRCKVSDKYLPLTVTVKRLNSAVDLARVNGPIPLGDLFRISVIFFTSAPLEIFLDILGVSGETQNENRDLGYRGGVYGFKVLPFHAPMSSDDVFGL